MNRRINRFLSLWIGRLISPFLPQFLCKVTHRISNFLTIWALWSMLTNDWLIVTNTGMVCDSKIGCNFAVSEHHAANAVIPNGRFWLYNLIWKIWFPVMTGTGFQFLTVYAKFFSKGVSHETCKVCVLLQTIKIAAQHPCGYHRGSRSKVALPWICNLR